MVRVFPFDCCELLDLGATLSFVTPYVANKLDILPECLLDPFSISTLINESILVERVYTYYNVPIYHRDTWLN